MIEINIEIIQGHVDLFLSPFEHIVKAMAAEMAAEIDADIINELKL